MILFSGINHWYLFGFVDVFLFWFLWSKQNMNRRTNGWVSREHLVFHRYKQSLFLAKELHMIIGKSTKPVYIGFIRFVSNLSPCQGCLRVTPSSALITLGLWFLRSKISKNHCHPHHHNRRRHQNYFENAGIAFVGTNRIRTTGRHLSQYCTGSGFGIAHPLVFLLHILSLWSSSCFSINSL